MGTSVCRGAYSKPSAGSAILNCESPLTHEGLTTNVSYMSAKPLEPMNAKLEVLTVLWSTGPATSREIYEVIKRKRKTEYGTFRELIQVMAEEGLVRSNKRRRTHVYESARPRRCIRKQLIRALMERPSSGPTNAVMIGGFAAREIEELVSCPINK